LHRLKDIIFDKRQYATVERAIEEAAKKRRKSRGKDKDINSNSGENQGEQEQTEAQEQVNDGGDPAEGEPDESGTKGDHGGFFASVLAYLRSPTQTVRFNNQYMDLIRPIRSRYLEVNP
ncbi:hypothetical protein BGZ72_003979, partial [Mortierella alpina]